LIVLVKNKFEVLTKLKCLAHGVAMTSDSMASRQPKPQDMDSGPVSRTVGLFTSPFVLVQNYTVWSQMHACARLAGPRLHTTGQRMEISTHNLQSQVLTPWPTILPKSCWF